MKKITVSLIIINGIQLLIGISIWIYIGIARLTGVNLTLYLAVSLMLLCNVATIVGLYLAMRYTNHDLEDSIHNLERLNAKLRAQRHDYLNHFQVIYGLMELEEYGEAKKYLAPVFKDIMKVSKALRTSQPAVNALLQVKMEAAERERIDFYPEIRSELSALPIEPWSLCKILANLIDNSIYVLSGEEKEEKKIILEMSEDAESYRFVVSNNGPASPAEMQSEIFRRGDASKKEEGHGMGLYIVREIVKEAGGDIALWSDETKTTFEIRLPRRRHDS